MHFNVFKGAKIFTTTITSSTPSSTIYTPTRDSLVFCNVYNTSSTFSFGQFGLVYFDTTGVGYQARNVIWKARQYYLNTALGQGTSGAYIEAGTAIKQQSIWTAGTIKIDLYVLELNDEVVVL